MSGHLRRAVALRREPCRFPVRLSSDSAVNATGNVGVLSLHQTSVGSGSDSEALTLLEYRDGQSTRWAAGRDRSVLAASLAAVTRAANTIPVTVAIP